MAVLIVLATTLTSALLTVSVTPTAAAERQSRSEPAVGSPTENASVLAAIPDPTTASLEATNGPLATATYAVPNPSGYGSGTITYPTAGGSYPSVVLMPGYQGTQQNLRWLAPRLASWGFVVINVGTFTPGDDPASRGRQISAAGTQLLSFGSAVGNPIYGKVNGTLGAAGHSMGGGGVMVALRDDSRFKAGVPLAPYNPNQNFSGVTDPTFFMTCQSDPVAHGDTYALPWYNSMSRAEKLFVEVPGDHLCPMTGYGDKAKQGKWIVSFFSRWLNGDTRFGPFLCGAAREADKNNPSLVTRWQDTCPF
ncbi:triacylglycerol lipase [Streptomyces sp. OE57]|uniref:poly(ethylene terephthalate) hydrolase family protein n=1 Tax=Streptomyces lacaronensis TaxID=3379885 RepID=UPI0039B788F0